MPFLPIRKNRRSILSIFRAQGNRLFTLDILAISRDNPDYVKADFINYRLGGAFTSILNQILREEKGFTYGASSYFQEMKVNSSLCCFNKCQVRCHL